MKIIESFPLKNLTTFHIGGPARYYTEVNNLDELKAALDFAHKENLELFLIGRGSNLLVSDQGFAGLVLHLNIFGLEKIQEDDDYIMLRIGANEVWDRVVRLAVNKNLWEIENLSGIPGSVGAGPVQNIGAYGQEICDVVAYVEAYDQHLKKLVKLSNKECQFSYRKSIFNTTARGRFLILYVIIKLSKKIKPDLKYQKLNQFLIDKNIHQPNIKQIREAVLELRQKTYVGQTTGGSAGSFFKNLLLNEEEFKELKNRIKKEVASEVFEKLKEIGEKFRISPRVDPRLSSGPGDNSATYKIPSAFVIDKICNLKGMQVGQAKISEKQALEIVNVNGQATADDVMNLFKKVRQAVYQQTGLILINEPQLVGFTQEELDDYFSLPKFE